MKFQNLKCALRIITESFPTRLLNLPKIVQIFSRKEFHFFSKIFFIFHWSTAELLLKWKCSFPFKWATKPLYNKIFYFLTPNSIPFLDIQFGIFTSSRAEKNLTIERENGDNGNRKFMLWHNIFISLRLKVSVTDVYCCAR